MKDVVPLQGTDRAPQNKVRQRQKLQYGVPEKGMDRVPQINVVHWEKMQDVVHSKVKQNERLQDVGWLKLIQKKLW